jgi:hypothetical protein
VGVTFHYPGRWNELDFDEYAKQLKVLANLGNRADVPVLWIGEYTTNPTPTDNQEVGKITRTKDGFEVDTDVIPLEDSIEVMWEHFGVDVSTPDYGKSFNEQPVDGFHEFTIDKLGLTTIDLDLIALSDDGLPIALIEIKRSSVYDIEDWYPFVGEGGDKPNYVLQEAAASATSTVPFIISQSASGYLNNSSQVYLYNLDEDVENMVRDFGRSSNPIVEDPHLSYSRVKQSAKQAAHTILG